MLSRLSFCALLLSLLRFVASAETPPPSTSGIEGVISISPSHGGPAREDIPNTAPAGNIEFGVKKEEEKVASFTTDAGGGFRILLPPGHYVVFRPDAGRIGRWYFETDVVAGKITKVQWTGDSGLR